MTDKQKTNLHDAHNAMSDEHLRYLYEHAMSHTPVFDLQRFGHHHGKSGGKMFASIAGFLVGFTTPWLFGAKAFAAGVMGASLFGSIWSASHTQNVDTGSADVSRFDRAQETMSSDGQIPVVYGTRQVTGNQTFHQTNADANTLHKHVVLCEGGIEGVVSVMANDMIIPTGSQTGNTVFTLMNNKYPDARVKKHGSDFDLWAGDNHHHIHLCTKKEVENSHDTYWEYQVSVTSLISYINQLYAEGWQAFPCAATNSYPGDLWDVEGNVYMDEPYGKVFGSSNAFQQQNHVSVDSIHGFVNFCADTIRGGTNYSFHDGDTPENYDTVGGYPAMAWLDMNFIVSNELNGNPSVSAVVMGKKVYDTRTKKTAYSTNPAMCLRDFMLSKRYGLGRWISADDLDEDSWNKAADYCDEEISFLDASGAIIKAKRFELNMVIDQKNSALDWLQEILANFQGYLTLTNGKFKLHIESQTDISYKFNDDNCSDLSVTPLSLSDTPNKYVVKIIDPRNNWTTVACNVEDYADQKERQKIITKEVNLNGTTSQYQALRLARFYRDQNLACPLTLSWKTGINGMHLEPGDVVTVSYHGVFTELPVRITEIKQDDDGKFDISGRQYNDTIYGDALGGGVHWYNYTDITQTAEKRTPSNPTNIKAYTQYRRYEDGTTGYDVICSYELPQRYDVETGLVYYKTNHLSAAQIGTFKEGEVVDNVGLSREWIYAGDSPTKIVISNAKVGDIYEFRVQSRTTDGLVSSESSAPTTTIKVTAKETVPSQPYNLTYNFTKAFTFMWSDIPDSDVMYYEIRKDTNVGSAIGLLGKTQSTSIDVNLMERKGTVYVYSVNTLKKYSYPAKVTYNYPKPDAPSYIHFTEALRGVNVLVAPFPARVKSMRLYIEGTKVSKALDLNNASYTFYGAPDIYEFWASYVDMMGEGYTSVKYAYTIKPEMNPEWIKDEAISLKKVDKTIQSAVSDAQQAIPRLDTLDANVTELKKTDGEIVATVTANKKASDEADASLASQLKQTAESITSTVQSDKKELSSQISQNADKITSVITNLGDPAKASAAYSAIAQMVDAIQLRVTADNLKEMGQSGQLMSYINLTPTTVSILSKLLHITADTLIDGNVITNGMIEAGAITADKLAASIIELTNSQGIKGGSVVLDTSGLACTDSNGMTIQFGQDGMTSMDKNGNRFSILAQCMMGVAKNGQYVKFANPWTESPTVIVTPQNIQTNNPAYSTSTVRLHCYADEVSVNGFRMRAYSGIANGAGSLVKNQSCGTITWSIWRSYDAWNSSNPVFGSKSISFNVSMPSNAGSVVLHGRLRTNTHFREPELKIPNSTRYQKLEVKCNGTTMYSDVLWNSGDGVISVAKNADTYTNITTSSIPVTQGASLDCTITINPCVLHPGDGQDTMDMEFILDSIDCKIEGEQVLDADGTGAFFVVNRSNGLYSITD
jgi:hypothetical protein